MKHNNRFLATLTALCLLGTMVPAAALAAEGQEAGHLVGCGYVCSHIHSGECGFAAAVEGRDCTDVHVHDADCGYAEASEEVNCVNGNCDGTEDGHVEHQDAVSAADCAYVHEHGAECGFAAETEGSPCSHVCGEDEWVCAGGCPLAADVGEEPLPAQVTVELEAEAGRTYTLSGVQECGYLFSGAGTVVLEDAVIAADEGFSAVTLADGAEVTVEISGACMLTGGAGGAGIAVPASAVLTLTGSGSLTAVGNGGTDEGGLSGAGIGGNPGQSSYAAAKEGIRGMSRVAASEWGPDNINVNIVCPIVMTKALEEWREREPEMYEKNVKAIPLGRFGDAEKDVGRVCVFLASPDASFVTGDTIMVQGGSGMKP